MKFELDKLYNIIDDESFILPYTIASICLSAGLGFILGSVTNGYVGWGTLFGTGGLFAILYAILFALSKQSS